MAMRLITCFYCNSRRLRLGEATDAALFLRDDDQAVTMTATDEQAGEEKTAKAAVLVACNEGPRAERALRRAASLAPLLGKKARALRVCDAGTKEADLAAAQAKLSGEAEACFAAGETDCEAVARIFPDYFHDEEAGRAACVLTEAEDCGAALIMLGAHGGTPRGRPLLGTMTQRLLGEVRRPVLIAQSEARGGYDKVLVAVDFSEFTPLCLDAADRFAPDAELVLVHAYEPSLTERLGGAKAAEEARAARLRTLVEDRKAGRRGEMRGTVRRGGPKAALSAAIEEEAPDLVILGTHGRLGAARASLGSTALGLIENPPCDLLIVPSR